MNTILIKKGDLLKAFRNNEFDAIIHGCNCLHTMGAGIAAAIKNQFIGAYNADLQTSYGDMQKLGTYSKAKTKNGDILNCYTQFAPGYTFNNKIPFSYHSYEKVLKKINSDYKGKRIGMPWIGCGLAGADREIVKELTEKYLTDCTVTLYEL